MSNAAYTEEMHYMHYIAHLRLVSSFLMLLPDVFLMITMIYMLQPACIGKLPNLEELWLDQNELETLPPVSSLVDNPF